MYNMKWSIKKKIITGFSSVIFLLVLLAGISYFELSSVNKTYNNIIEVTSKKVDLANQLETQFYQQSANIRGYLLTGSTSYYNQYQVAKDNYKNTMIKLKKLVKSSLGKSLYASLDDMDDKYFAAAEHQIELKNENKQDELTLYTSNTVNDITISFQKSIEDLKKHQEDELLKVNSETTVHVKNVQALLIIITVATFIIAIIIEMIIGRMISNPIKKVSDAMKVVAMSDLSIKQVKVKSKPSL